MDPYNPNFFHDKSQFEVCSAQTQTGIGHLRKPPGVELIPCCRKLLRRTRTLRKRRYIANKCGWTQPLFRKARDHGVN